MNFDIAQDIKDEIQKNLSKQEIYELNNGKKYI